MDSVAKDLLLLVRKQGEFTDDLLYALHSVFKQTFVQALDIIDKRGVVQMVTPSGRSFFQVAGSASNSYICLTESNYCSCLSYLFSVLKSDALLCKHVLAATLASHVGALEERAISDNEYLTTLCASELQSQQQ